MNKEKRNKIVVCSFIPLGGMSLVLAAFIHPIFLVIAALLFLGVGVSHYIVYKNSGGFGVSIVLLGVFFLPPLVMKYGNDKFLTYYGYGLAGLVMMSLVVRTIAVIIYDQRANKK